MVRGMMVQIFGRKRVVMQFSIMELKPGGWYSNKMY